jgi:hypothetical protein
MTCGGIWSTGMGYHEACRTSSVIVKRLNHVGRSLSG